jgi:hypothetical protein
LPSGRIVPVQQSPDRIALREARQFPLVPLHPRPQPLGDARIRDELTLARSSENPHTPINPDRPARRRQRLHRALALEDGIPTSVLLDDEGAPVRWHGSPLAQTN